MNLIDPLQLREARSERRGRAGHRRPHLHLRRDQRARVRHPPHVRL